MKCMMAQWHTQYKNLTTASKNSGNRHLFDSQQKFHLFYSRSSTVYSTSRFVPVYYVHTVLLRLRRI